MQERHSPRHRLACTMLKQDSDSLGTTEHRGEVHRRLRAQVGRRIDVRSRSNQKADNINMPFGSGEMQRCPVGPWLFIVAPLAMKKATASVRPNHALKSRALLPLLSSSSNRAPRLNSI